MELKEKEIQSIRKVLDLKRSELSLNPNLLELKGLRKFGHLESISIPKNLGRYVYFDINKRFIGVKYPTTRMTLIHQHYFEKMVSVLVKELSQQFEIETSDYSFEEKVDELDRRLREDWEQVPLEIQPVQSSMTRNMIQAIGEERGKLHHIEQIIEINVQEADHEKWYTILDIPIPKKMCNTFQGRVGSEYAGQEVKLVDVFSYIAKHWLLKMVERYLSHPQQCQLIFEKISTHIEVDEIEFFKFIPIHLGSLLWDNRGTVPSFIQTVVVLTMETMLQQFTNFQEVEQRMVTQTGHYAKTFMTKKNIPKKALEFMDSNTFLNYFDFVEVDEDCDLEKLKVLEQEFVALTNVLPIDRMPNHALRFRKLGKLKAAGVYYPGHQTLALDIDGIHSFLHEWFHLLDFTNDLLSLNPEFQAIQTLYNQIVETNVETLGANHVFYQQWYGNSKFNARYYQSSDEVFARLGEIYVGHHLGLKSNFAKSSFDESDESRAIYPLESTLLDNIIPYYDRLFQVLSSKKKEA